jgi:hypothetical protein
VTTKHPSHADSSLLRRCIVIAVLLSLAALVGQRIVRYATFDATRHAMPAAMANDEERRLFQSPGGKYTLADIAANGNQLPSEKYRGFRAVHDYQPRPGDRLCPVTRTKANSACTWIVDGQTYEFCCPPCIAEFVDVAKRNPGKLLPANAYVEGTR